MKKFFIVLLAYYLVVLLQSCCNCPMPDFPYFDYKSIKVSTSSELLGEFDERYEFNIYINPSEGEIVAENNIGFNLISPAMACSCSEDGDVGQKYRVTKINIYTDTIFNNSIPIGEPLNELFEVVTQRTIYGIPTYALSLDEAPNHIYAFNLHRESSVIALTLKDKPSTKRPYKFKVELTKENGEMLFAETDYIEFE